MVFLIFNICLFKIQFILLGQEKLIKSGTFDQAPAKDGPLATYVTSPGLSQGDVSEAYTQSTRGQRQQPCRPRHFTAAQPGHSSGATAKGRPLPVPAAFLLQTNRFLLLFSSFFPHLLFCLPFKKDMAREKKNTKARGLDEHTSTRYEQNTLRR